MLSNRVLAVDAVLKGVIEQLDPGIHGFYPVEIAMPKGRVFPRSYFVLVIGRYLQSFLPEHSKPGSWNERSSGIYHHDPTKKGGAAWRSRGP